MKPRHLDYLPAILFLFSLIYFSVVGHSIASSIVIGFITLAFCYQQYLFRTEQPDVHREVIELKERLEKEIQSVRNTYDQQIKDMEDEVSKVALSASRLPSMQVKKEREKINF